MTLGGLAAAIGLVIDDAIVVVENIVMHRDAGEHRAEAVRKALKEITTPLVFSTHHAGGGLSAAGLDERRHGQLLPRAGDHHDSGAAHVARSGAHLDAGVELRAVARPRSANDGSRMGTRKWRTSTMAAAARPGAGAASYRAGVGAGQAGVGRRASAWCWCWPPGAAINCWAPICCRRWTRAASSSTTSCPRAVR